MCRRLHIRSTACPLSLIVSTTTRFPFRGEIAKMRAHYTYIRPYFSISRYRYNNRPQFIVMNNTDRHYLPSHALLFALYHFSVRSFAASCPFCGVIIYGTIFAVTVGRDWLYLSGRSALKYVVIRSHPSFGFIDRVAIAERRARLT